MFHIHLCETLLSIDGNAKNRIFIILMYYYRLDFYIYSTLAFHRASIINKKKLSDKGCRDRFSSPLTLSFFPESPRWTFNEGWLGEIGCVYVCEMCMRTCVCMYDQKWDKDAKIYRRIMLSWWFWSTHSGAVFECTAFHPVPSRVYMGCFFLWDISHLSFLPSHHPHFPYVDVFLGRMFY